MPNTAPVITVITPAYNAEAFLESTIRSVIGQTYVLWEMLIVVDSASRDRTGKIAAEWAGKDPRIKAVAGPTPSGVSANRNLGLALSRTEYVAFLDSDDLWRPAKLEKQVQWMNDNQLNFTFHAYHCIDENGAPLPNFRSVPRSAAREDLLANNTIGCSTVMIRRSWKPRLRFPEGGHEDLRLWLDLLKEGDRADGLDQDLMSYRIVRASRSNNKLRAAIWRWKIFAEIQDIPWRRKAFLFMKYAFNGLLKRF